MNIQEDITRLQEEMEKELLEDILPYWNRYSVDYKHGGFVGQVTSDNKKVDKAEKGGILNARILWTFSSCYNRYGTWEMKSMAQRAYKYLMTNFWDNEYGGIYWMLKADGSPADTRKHIYAQAFAIYALCEYANTTGEDRALETAHTLFRQIENVSADNEYGGYYEAFSREWEKLEDVRLSEKDINEPKSMNTHLHLLEAYTNLYRHYQSKEIRQRLESLLDVFLDHIIRPDGQSLYTFLDMDWTPKSKEISYGHDIETSWLLTEAVDELPGYKRKEKVEEASLSLATAVLNNGTDEDGALVNEAGPDGWDDLDKDYWPQAEAIVGFFNVYQKTGKLEFKDAAIKTWGFVKDHLIDKEGGEWWDKVDRTGKPYRIEKIHAWKGPYHHSRACLEITERTKELADKSVEKEATTNN